jgi:hypothetical protein
VPTSTFVLLISICAKLKLSASKSPTSQSRQTLAGIVNGQQDNENARQENSST